MHNIIFNWLKGHWRFQRNIPLGIASGIAHFSETTQVNALHYKESGIILCSDHKKIHFHNRYLYTLHNNPTAIAIYFLEQEKSGKLFCKLAFDKNARSASGKHLCKLDHYFLNYQFDLANQQFILTTTIHGPAKNQTIQTTYDRHQP